MVPKRQILFAYYRDQYGEYQARKLLLLDRHGRRARIDFLERQLTRETDTSQPLWPEMNYEQKMFIVRREEIVRSITRKNRLNMQLSANRERLEAYQAAHIDDTRPEIGQTIQEFCEKLESQELETYVMGEMVDLLKINVKASEARMRRIIKANELIRLPPSERAKPSQG